MFDRHPSECYFQACGELPLSNHHSSEWRKVMNQPTISCDLHDYLELACMHHYKVRLTLNNQQIIEGKALDTLTTAEKQEYLILDIGQEQSRIELNQLRKMEVLTHDAKFKEVYF
jgi:Rho-binding antiterminator